jgi:hypothetical protein
MTEEKQPQQHDEGPQLRLLMCCGYVDKKVSLDFYGKRKISGIIPEALDKFLSYASSNHEPQEVVSIQFITHESKRFNQK